jgi:hypothetical protein
MDTMTRTEVAFLQACRVACDEYETLIGRRAPRARQILAAPDPVATVIRLCVSPKLHDELLVVLEHGRLDLSWESVALRHEFAELTSEEQKAAIRRKLAPLN